MALLEQLSAIPEYTNRVNSNINALQKKFNLVKALLSQPLSNDNYNDAFHLFYEIFDVMPVLHNNVSLPIIIRGRPYHKSESLFNEKWQLSYNETQTDKIELGRFNQIKEPLFYGSLPTDEGISQQIMSAALECCKKFFNREHNESTQDVAIGFWKITTPFNLVNLCFDDVHLQYNKEMKEGIQEFLIAIKSSLNSAAAKFIEEFFRFFSKLSRRLMANNENYQVLGPLFIGLRYYSNSINKTNIYGLMYPGAMSAGNGLNVVLTKDASDFITLKKVVMYRFQIHENNKDVSFYPCSDFVDVKNDRFEITNYIASKAI